MFCLRAKLIPRYVGDCQGHDRFSRTTYEDCTPGIFQELPLYELDLELFQDCVQIYLEQFHLG